MRPLVLTPTGTGQLQLLRTNEKSNQLLQPLHKVLSTSLYLTLSVYVLLDVHFQNPSQSREDAFHHAEKIFRLIPAKVGPSSTSPRGGPRPRNQHHCPTSVAPPFLSFNPSHHRGESLLLLAQWEPNPIPPKGGTPRPRMNGWISASAPFLRKSLFSDAFSQKNPLRVQFC